MAEEELEQESTELNLHSVGETLRHAREQKDLDLEAIAKTTRIPQRHLSSIEAGDFGALPGRTYAIGFAKSYARAVGLSDAAIGSQLREEMDEQGHGAYQPETSGYSPANPTSIPPKALALTALGIGAVVLVGYLVWRTLFFSPSGIDPTEPETQVAGEVRDNQDGQSLATENSAPTPSSSGTVMLTARENVWLKIYDQAGDRLFEKEMAQGEQYTVPADAEGPQILTGRPDALAVTIDGQAVPDLGTAERTISDVGISAEALLARTDAEEPANVDEPGQTVNN